MRLNAAILGVLLLAVVPTGWARAADGNAKADPKAKDKKAVVATPTPPAEPKIPDREITMKGKLMGTVDGMRFEQAFSYKGKTSEKAFVHCNEPGLDVSLGIMPKPIKDDNDNLLLDMYIHCKTRKRQFQRQAQVMVSPADTAPIDLNSKSDKDKISVEVVVGK